MLYTNEVFLAQIMIVGIENVCDVETKELTILKHSPRIHTMNIVTRHKKG
jgi:hypothetical protein